MKAHEIVFDIETYRTRDVEVVARVTKAAIEKECPGSASRKAKDLWDTSESRQARVDAALGDTAKCVTLAEVVCVGYETDRGRVCCARDDEVELLRSIAVQFNELAGPETVWVGHNIEGFDLGILLNRWRRWKIRPPEYFPVFAHGHWRGRVYDTMQRVPSQAGFVKLEEACRMYHVSMRDVMWRREPMDGSRVGAVFDAGEWDVLESYCIEDVLSTHALYEVMTHQGKWGTLAGNNVWGEVRALESASDISEGVRAVAIVNLLKRAGIF